jgi:hypothetical protein
MNSDQRERNRLKVARWRARHANRLAAEAEQRTGLSEGNCGRPTYHVREWMDRDGLPVLVLVVKAGQQPDIPAGLTESTAWVPTWPMNHRMAKRLRSFRLCQIVAWCGGTRPEWLQRS